MTTPLRDYTKIEEKNRQLVTHYGDSKKLNFPYNVAIGPNDEVVIVNRENNEVIILDKDLKLIRTFGQGSGDSKLNLPDGITVGHSVIAVSDRKDHVVKKFSLQGDYLSKLGSCGRGDSQFINPQGLCFNSKGLLFVVDYGNCRVQVFRENVFLFKFGSKGHNPGEFQDPCYIAVDSSDQVYVTDYSICSNDGRGISVFSEDGHFIKRINCNSPFAICIAPDDYIMVTIHDYNSIAVFSPTHECIAKFGVYGKGKGQVSNITGIAINSIGTIIVTQYGNGILQIIDTIAS